MKVRQEKKQDGAWRKRARAADRNMRGKHTYWSWLARHWYCSYKGCKSRGVTRLLYCDFHAQFPSFAGWRLRLVPVAGLSLLPKQRLRIMIGAEVHFRPIEFLGHSMVGLVMDSLRIGNYEQFVSGNIPFDAIRNTPLELQTAQAKQLITLDMRNHLDEPLFLDSEFSIRGRIVEGEKLFRHPKWTVAEQDGIIFVSITEQEDA